MMMFKPTAAVLLSGGVDSSTCLGLAVKKYGSSHVLALTIFYGQRHEREIKSAQNIAAYYHVPMRQYNVEKIFASSNCSLLSHSDEEIPEESYFDQLQKTDGEPVSTYVPFRNGLFLSIATSIALSFGCKEVIYGAHADDAAGNAYPDCSVDFVESMNKAIQEGTSNKIRLVAPFISLPKREIVRQGLEIGVPYELTFSCYEGGEKPCGVCGTCRDRKQAFLDNGVEDPVEYME